MTKPYNNSIERTIFKVNTDVSGPAVHVQIFRGNIDNNTPSANSFTPPIEAQFVRIYPQVCRRHCTLRMELLGCELTG